MDPESFERLVADALDELPEPFASRMSNVVVEVADDPSPEQLRSVGAGGTLLGLYHGVPQTERGGGYTFTLPDRITIFRRPILRMCRTPEEVRRQVVITVVHEIAHHFGISDERLDELGY